MSPLCRSNASQIDDGIEVTPIQVRCKLEVLHGQLVVVNSQIDRAECVLKNSGLRSVYDSFRRELPCFLQLAAIQQRKTGKAGEKPVKQVELDALLAVPEGYGDDVPIDPNFHARRLTETVWRRSERSAPVEAVIQLHRLREVLALVGFTRFEAVTPDINGEYETDVERADIAIEPSWFPAVENRGEGVFLKLRATAIKEWLARKAVKDRLQALADGRNELPLE